MSNNEKFNLKVTPIGGVGEIGSNMTVFEASDEYLIIDYGILFPYEDFFDINYLIADFSHLDTDKKTTLFFTHGHEDHIGAIVHIVEKFSNLTIYAPPFATVLIRRKLKERNLSHEINIYKEEDVIEFDQFELHPIHVTHSIPDTFGLILKDKKDKLSILFISDFKYDLNPLYEKPFNIEKTKELFNKSEKRYCFLDSTNILNPGGTLSESDLVDDLDEIISRGQRTFFTLFSSNIWRLKTILELAKKHNRYVVPVGRSIHSYLNAASESGLVDLDPTYYKDIDAVENPRDPRIIGILTGCQGDYRGALRRISSNEHKQLKLGDKDLVVFSSKPIPGNEKKINRIYNDIAAYGTEIITSRDMQIHASGHPGQKDLLNFLSEIKPTHYIPIHGEVYFLKKHIEFIKEHTNAIPIELGNFGRLSFDENYDFHQDSLEALDPQIVHGKGLIIGKDKISERRKVACNGVVFLSINKKSRTLSMTHKGLPELVEEYEEAFYDILSNLVFNDGKNKKEEILSEDARIKVRQMYGNILGYKPIAMVHIS